MNQRQGVKTGRANPVALAKTQPVSAKQPIRNLTSSIRQAAYAKAINWSNQQDDVGVRVKLNSRAWQTPGYCLIVESDSPFPSPPHSMDVSNVRLRIDDSETGYSGDSDRWIAEVAYDPVARRIAGTRSSSASQVTRCYALLCCTPCMLIS